MKRLRIGLDVDGVLADFANPAMDIGREMFPDAQIHNGIWDLGMSKEQADAVMAEVAKRRDFFYGLDKIPGGEDLSEVQNRHTLYFITARTQTAGMPIEEQTAHWLRWLYRIHTPTVIVVERSSDKAKLYEALHLVSYLDDRADTVTQMLERGQNCFVYDQPWNQGVDAPRVKSVNEYLAVVEAQLGGRT